MSPVTPRIELNPFADPPDANVAGYYNSNQSSGHLSSMETSRPGSAGGNRPKDKKRVGFNEPAEPKYRKQRPASITLPARITLSPPTSSPGYSPNESPFASYTHSRDSSGTGEPLLPSLLPPPVPNRAHLPTVSVEVSDQIKAAFNEPIIPSSPTMPRVPPRPVLRRGDSALSVVSDTVDDTVQSRQAREAYERGKRLERDERVSSAPGSRTASPSRVAPSRLTVPRLGLNGLNEIPLEEFSNFNDDVGSHQADMLQLAKDNETVHHLTEAQKLVRAHTLANKQDFNSDGIGSGLQSGAVTPVDERDAYFDVPKPKRYRTGVLSTLLKLYNQEEASRIAPSHSRSNSASMAHPGPFRDTPSALSTPGQSPPTSGFNTPVGKYQKPWYSAKNSHSSSSLAHLVGSSAMGASPVMGLGEQVTERLRQQQQEAERKRPSLGSRSRSSNMLNRLSRFVRDEHRTTITRHLAETLARQKYLEKLCRALMQCGAPTHRLEELMMRSANAIGIHASFLYIPGSMVISFNDPETHTTEVKLIRESQGIDLGKLHDVHEVYKDIIHDRIAVEDASETLRGIMKHPKKYGPWTLVLMSGLASASVGPFAFSASFYDLPICFFLGCITGALQHIIAPQSELYANVFEISATVITSFLARAFGSIAGGKYFCFAACAQSAITLILPGYMVLCASLELQSRSLVAGSVRMVYAIIFSLFLGFGITIGTVIYGLMDENAVSSTVCENPLTDGNRPVVWISVPVFTVCIIVISQAKWKQAPVMVIIAFAGYMVSYFASQRFAGNTEVSSMLAALVIGVMANLYSRVGTRIECFALDVWEDRLRPYFRAFHKKIRGKSAKLRRHSKSLEAMEAAEDAESIMLRRKRRVGYGLAAAAMLPAIFVQVPSGLAVSGSLISGITAADQIVSGTSNGTTTTSTSTSSSDSLNSIAFNVGYSVVEVAIGISVGLFMSAIVVYPFGKKRSGLFSL